MNNGVDLTDWCYFWNWFVCIDDERRVGSWNCKDQESICWYGWADVEGFRKALKAFRWLRPGNFDREVCFRLIKSWNGFCVLQE